MEPPRDDKYIVLRREDVVWIGGGTARFTTNHVLEDAVVIRRQDAFAPPALDAYANSITIALGIMRNSTIDDTPIDWDPDQHKRLQEIADYFHAQAVAAWETHRKIPD